MILSKILQQISIFILFFSNLCLSKINEQTITLRKNNFVSIKDEVSEQNVNKWSNTLNKLNSNTIYLYIDSPGGSVDAGLQFINVINYHKNQGKTINCIAKSAYSMAFVIFQNCSNRYVISSTTLMQHQISLSGIRGPLNNLMNYLDMINKISYELDNMVSTRIKMDLTEYRNKISNDWWIYGNLAIEQGVADEYVVVGCETELYETDSQEELILNLNSLGELELTSDSKTLCPL
jgi:ATP-dependent Clp protease protease subunit